MTEATTRSSDDRRLVLVAGGITLAVTLARLAGELLHLSPTLFGDATGAGALVGISWLVPLFGAWFGTRLGRQEAPPRPLVGLARLVGAGALMPLLGVAARPLGINPQSLTMLALFSLAAIAGVALALPAWPRLGRALLGYALAARVPVALLMLFAILGHWGTHYDPVLPKELQPMTRLQTWLWLGALPQLTIWIAYTLVIGGLFGLAAGVVAARRRSAAARRAA
jgi:hypothetical protein